MTGLPRQVTRFLRRLASATRDAERQWVTLAGSSEATGADQEFVSSVIRQLAWRAGSTAHHAVGNDEPSRPGVGRQNLLPFASAEAFSLSFEPLRELLESSDLTWAARCCAEHMGADPSRSPPGDYLVDLFLAALDPQQRKRHGVYFTPWPLVQYLVRSMDVLLRKHLQIPEGLASLGVSHDRSPIVIDPACGTGLFLRAVLRQVFRSGRTESGGPASDGPISAGPVACAARNAPLSPAKFIQGFDVLPGTIAAARDLLALDFPELASAGETFHCRSALNRETDRRIDSARLPDSPVVILGNPPYANFGRANRDPWILDLMRDYQTGLGEKKHNLHDDVWKFLRWSQYQVERAGTGIVALVLNHALLDGLTHRQLRGSLLSSFDHLYFYNLHGSHWRPSEVADEQSSGPDENVFDVRCGITLCLLVRANSRNGDSRQAPTLHYAEIRGSRERKFEQLQAEAEEGGVAATQWLSSSRPRPTSHDSFLPPRRKSISTPGAMARSLDPNKGFVASQSERKDGREDLPNDRSGSWGEYDRGWGLDQIFAQYVSGVQTKNDSLFTDRDIDTLAERMRRHAMNESDGGEGPRVEFDPKKLRPYMVAPFDLRWIYYEPRWLGRARFQVMRHLIAAERFEHVDNVALVFMRQSTNPGHYDHFLVTRHLMSDRVLHSGHGAPYAAPLWLQEDSGAWRGNFRDEFIQAVESNLEISYFPEAESSTDGFGPRDLLAYLYGVACTPGYRRQFAQELPRGFPRIPLPDNLERFRAVGRLGHRLVQLHGSVGPVAKDSSTAISETPKGGENALHPCLPPPDSQPPTIGDWEDVLPRPIWETRIGGVAVIPRWLKQRKAHPLAAHERAYLSQLIVVCEQTLDLQQQLNQLSRQEGRSAAEDPSLYSHVGEKQ
jgi:hypothetical protein